MISVYDRNETDFFHNGIVLSEVIQCIIEEELNGKYVLELVHPIDKQGRWEYLTEENIIKADGQLFRIYSTEKTLDRIYVYARHIFYDLLHNFLEDVRPTNLNGAAALDWILSHTLYSHPFTGTSDIDTINTRYFVRVNPVEAILGDDGLVERWGGELVRDNFTIKLLKQRGSNKGAKIAYGKNLLGLEVKRDMDTVVTRIMPVGRDGLLLPEKYVDSPLIDNYAYPRVRVIQFDIGVDEETTEEEAYEKLRQASRELYEKNKIDIPTVNITVNLLLLENTEEYKNLKQLEKVELGDIVSCTDNPLKITFEAKVIRVKKDVIANRNVEVELGQYKKGISNTIRDVLKNISEEIKNTSSSLEESIEKATQLLTNALGGHVLKRPGELLIMDTDDPATAEKVWRWNLNGLGYSSNGINGPYRLAMTMDGQIVADFITTGTLDANLIKTGTLRGRKVEWNLEDGTLLIGNNTEDYNLYYDGNNLRIKFSGNDLESELNSTAKIDTVNELLNNVTTQFGESLNQRSDEILNEVNNSLSEVESKIKSELSAEIQLTAEQLQISFTELQEILDGNNTLLNSITTYFNFSDEGFTIGKSNSPFKINLTNEQMTFLENEAPVAWINAQRLYITDAQITNSFILGNHIWEKYNDQLTFVRYLG